MTSMYTVEIFLEFPTVMFFPEFEVMYVMKAQEIHFLIYLSWENLIFQFSSILRLCASWKYQKFSDFHLFVYRISDQPFLVFFKVM